MLVRSVVLFAVFSSVFSGHVEKYDRIKEMQQTVTPNKRVTSRQNMSGTDVM